MSEEITDEKRFRAILAIAESYVGEGTVHDEDLARIEGDAVQVIDTEQILADLATIARICREAAEAAKKLAHIPKPRRG